MKAVLGLDTSCYVTSVALVSDTGGILFDGRTPLAVEQGGLGLRQSEAFFLHMRQLPDLISKAFEVLREKDAELAGVAASAAPREYVDSYMPVFLAGMSTAKMLAASNNVPLHTFSHQQGHLRAAEIGCDAMPERYIGVHLSGGTTEAVIVDRRTWTCERIAGTSDIAAGQWIDRIGVLMGCPFPAGPHLEAFAKNGRPGQKPIGIPFKDGALSFSGAEAEVKRRVQDDEDQSDIALEMFLSLGRALCKMIVYANETTGLCDALIGGGVAANSILRTAVVGGMAKRRNSINVRFAQIRYAGDNAVGIALLGIEGGTGC